MKMKKVILWSILIVLAIALIYISIKYPFEYPPSYCDTFCLLRTGGL